MTDSDRRSQAAADDDDRSRQARLDFEEILAKFLELRPSEHKGSFTVNFSGHRVRTVEWRVMDDASRWDRRESA